MNKKGTGRCRDPTGPEEKTINEKKGKDDGKRKKDGCETSRNRRRRKLEKGIVSFCWQGQELWQRHF